MNDSKSRPKKINVYVATPSEVDKPYLTIHQGTRQFILGKVGMWIVWDVVVGQHGYFARLVAEKNGAPEGFSPCIIKGETWGYSRKKGVKPTILSDDSENRV
ncbi:MAG: hypothetical protein HQL72_12265 [Magnetococcales bacterium]|nr:hypothetical protein [Magnetococcales bacterium]